VSSWCKIEIEHDSYPIRNVRSRILLPVLLLAMTLLEMKFCLFRFPIPQVTLL
jgi:hypothetical protein